MRYIIRRAVELQELQFGETQTVAAIVFAAIAAILAVVFLLGALQSRRELPFPSVQKVGFWIRTRWLVFLIALLVGVVGTSLFFLPFSGSAEKRVSIDVTAGQFFWNFSRDTVEPGTRVRFRVTSDDVNHGFGLYGPDGVMVAQVQAMPDYTNKLDVTFKKEGVYTIACLEYCGLQHHKMFAKFRVVK